MIYSNTTLTKGLAAKPKQHIIHTFYAPKTGNCRI